MSKDSCILNNQSKCSECGECYTCDLDRNKTCNSCGKCLEENIDMRSVEIDEIIEEDYDESECFDEDKILKEEWEGNLEEIEFIDDIEGLRDLLEDEKTKGEYTYEEFPGLIRIKGKK